MTGILCPECGSICDRVIDTRRNKKGVRRRRVCAGCGYRVTTQEVLTDKEGSRRATLAGWKAEADRELEAAFSDTTTAEEQSDGEEA